MSGDETGPGRVDVNSLWAGAFVEELARAGVTDVCVAPGSRSTPLVLAFAAHGSFRMRVHLDERSAGFFALGLAKATGVPAVVLTTSGTATANLFPAVMEASQGDTPLLVLTADRPHRHRDSDANQAVDQIRLYGPFVREFFEVAPPAAHDQALRHLRGLAARAVAAAIGVPAGPVHLNFPFDRPLEPVPDADDAAFAARHPLAARGRADGAPYVSVGFRAPVVSEVELDELAERIAGARRPLLVAGPADDPVGLGEAVLGLAAVTGIPVLADPLSGARWLQSEGARSLGAYDLVLREPRARVALRPDLVIRVGRSPTSTVLLEYLEGCGAGAHVVIDPSHRWKDHLALATDVLRGDATLALHALADRAAGGRVDPAWSGLWRALEAAALAAIEAALDGEPFEGAVARRVVEAAPYVLFLSNSMPVRDVDAFGGGLDRDVVALGNRGASGIDGIVSTALGVAAGSQEPIVALIGDIALLHDSNGLLATREPDARVVFVVVNNDGGAIFHFLPIREHEPHFTPLFATPHGIAPARLAALYGVRHEVVEPERIGDRVRAALDEPAGSTILEVKSDRNANRRRRDEVVEQVRAAVAARLDGEPEGERG